MKRKKLVRSVIMASLVMVFLAGCANLEKDWRRTRSWDLIWAYQEFLSKHPGSQYEADAKARISFLKEKQARQQEAERVAQAIKPLEEAINLGDLTKVQEILAASPGLLNGATGDQEMTPLHLAANRGNTEIVELLLTKGANIEAREFNGWTPLFSAVIIGQDEKTAKLLLDKGARVNARDLLGMTPLKWVLHGQQGPLTNPGVELVAPKAKISIADLLRRYGGTE
ncbi:MAG TPA: ankyrin repeat domain-containing protein [Candidatus Wujingus californicus]|uniref:ankyrin repeat domain-containing protein n=1 Tax=Candidatus Wujingus californicus TaxID=3367618 RepID=UPI001DD2163C|nr:ankyrin repeat domain-containing protein [Planctomycetota bacterium]MDO8094814.1 ankyrin repeat domain-containing protein [Candidatus Brocadiales bacterium]MDO8131747.1 ankyrin repeat domain-containing protein [Candidatus Brocadiales bacterium]